MGKKGLKKAALQVNPLVVEFVEAAAAGNVKAVKKVAKAGRIEIDDGESEGVVGLVGTWRNVGIVGASPETRRTYERKQFWREKETYFVQQP